MEQEMRCPECGAKIIGGKTCETQYHECLVKEFTDAGYGAVHHLTVAAYMLQHSSKLSLKGWLEMQRLLKKFLIENKPPADIRRQNKNSVDSSKRKWNITSKDGMPKISRTEWAKTILDVRLNAADEFCADVTVWAKSALMDSERVA
jgi:hypothetical protein